MFIARWQIDARFGISRMSSSSGNAGCGDRRKAGTDQMDVKILTGSIGAREATVEINHTVESLAQLENSSRRSARSRRIST